MTTISVIICTRDRRPSLLRCLGSLVESAQRAPTEAVEFIVVDDGSTDDTVASVRRLAAGASLPIRLLQQAGSGLSRARNLGVAHAQGAVLAFVDDDCQVSADYITDLVAHFRSDTGLVLRGGRVELGNPQDAALTIKTSTTTERLSNRADIGGFILGCNMTMPRDLLVLAGPFDNRFGCGTLLRSAEDTDLIIRALVKGFPVEYVGDMTVFHFHGRRSRDDIWKAHRNYNIGNGALMAKHLFSAPWYMRNWFWRLRNAVKEAVGGPVFDDRLGFSHGPMVLHHLLGAVLFAWMKLKSGRSFRTTHENLGPAFPVSTKGAAALTCDVQTDSLG